LKNTGKLILAGILTLAAAGLLIRSARRPRPALPKEVLDIRVRMIDEKTLAVIERSVGEWESAGIRNGRRRNPDSGEFTVVSIATCGACSAEIPAPVIDLGKLGVDRKDRRAMEAAMLARLDAITCPKCGKSPRFGLKDMAVIGAKP